MWCGRFLIWGDTAVVPRHRLRAEEVSKESAHPPHTSQDRTGGAGPASPSATLRPPPFVESISEISMDIQKNEDLFPLVLYYE
jgi:hypothetical protein